MNNMLNIMALNQQFEQVNPARFWNDKLDALVNTRPNPPTIVCGDFNEVSGGRCIRLLQKKANLFDAGWEKGHGQGLTYHGHKIMHFRLDHILHSEEIKLNSIEVLDWTYSDHIPLMITFEIKH